MIRASVLESPDRTQLRLSLVMEKEELRSLLAVLDRNDAEELTKLELTTVVAFVQKCSDALEELDHG